MKLKLINAPVFLLMGWAITASVLAGPNQTADLSVSSRMVELIDELVSEQGFERQPLVALFAEAEYKQSIIDAITRPAEKTLAWHEYRKIFVTKKRSARGRVFAREYAAILERAEQEYGVPTQVIAAIIGVETYYGRQKGGYRVLDSLSTLAASDYRRNNFFRNELKAFLILSRDEGQDPRAAVGSYAGAIGIPQFMPTSYQRYAVDFDGDGQRDLVNSVADAIGSVGNYLAEHGWQRGAAVLDYVSYAYAPDDSIVAQGYKPHSSIAALRQLGAVWSPAVNAVDDQQAALVALGQKSGHTMVAVYQNFYVITRYNHSPLYAMAVFQLSETLNKGAQR